MYSIILVFIFRPIIDSVGSFVERSWAYLTIKKLLDQSDIEHASEKNEKLKSQALSLSLKVWSVYGTSMTLHVYIILFSVWICNRSYINGSCST